jgi:hypothetical protein
MADADTPTGKVTFVGAGPGAADLLTFRAARAIAEADVVIWAASLVQAEVLDHAREGAEILDSATMSLEDVVAVYERAGARGCGSPVSTPVIRPSGAVLRSRSTGAPRSASRPRSSRVSRRSPPSPPSRSAS